MTNLNDKKFTLKDKSFIGNHAPTQYVIKNNTAIMI